MDGTVGCRLSIHEVLSMKFIVTAGLLLASTFAHAQTSHWAFSYTGFYDQEAAVFLPDMRIDGSFTGVDANGDGVLERGELTSLLVDAKDYVACAAGSSHRGAAPSGPKRSLSCARRVARSGRAVPCRT